MTKLESIRKNKNLSRRALAKQIGVSHTIIGYWETGERPIEGMSIKTLLDLSRALKVKPYEILDGDLSEDLRKAMQA